MPARRIGWVIERTWVSGVVRVGVREEGGIVLEGGEEVRRREQG